MAVLITGGAGFIGRHTAKLLATSGVEFVVLDNLSTGRRNHVTNAALVEGDITDLALVRNTLRVREVTAVIHLAARAHVHESLLRPDLYFATNTVGTTTLLNAMMAEGVRSLVFASSCSVYGNSNSSSASESDHVAPVSPYGESKLNTEHMLPWYERAFGLRWTALRYFNVAGAVDDLGEDIAQSRRIIPRTVHTALHQGSALEIYGTEFPTPDGSAVRDFVHVTDVAQANLFALRYVEQENPSAVINIGAGTGVSTRDIIAAVAQQTQREVAWHARPAKPGDPPWAVSDIAKAAQILGWVPTRSGITEIVQSILYHQPQSHRMFDITVSQ